MLDCVSLAFNILDNKTGPNSLTVARILVPLSSEIVSNSTGIASGSKSRPMAFIRSSILGCPGLGLASPERSPFTSINRTGTPCLLNCSAITCKVFVFPVPVAPEIKPWRLKVDNGAFTSVPVKVSSPSMAPPKVNAEPSNVYPCCIVSKNLSLLAIGKLSSKLTGFHQF